MGVLVVSLECVGVWVIVSVGGCECVLVVVSVRLWR